MRALGMDNDRDIFAAIAGPVEAMTRASTVANLNDVKDNEEYSVETEDEALAWLEKKFAAGQQKEYRETRINNLLDKELPPPRSGHGTQKQESHFPWQNCAASTRNGNQRRGS